MVGISADYNRIFLGISASDYIGVITPGLHDQQILLYYLYFNEISKDVIDLTMPPELLKHICLFYFSF